MSEVREPMVIQFGPEWFVGSARGLTATLSLTSLPSPKQDVRLPYASDPHPRDEKQRRLGFRHLVWFFLPQVLRLKIVIRSPGSMKVLSSGSFTSPSRVAGLYFK